MSPTRPAGPPAASLVGRAAPAPDSATGSVRPALGDPSRPVGDRSRLMLLALLALAAAAGYLLLGLHGNIGYALTRRATTLATLGVVGTAIALSTVLFQTATHNRILTPSVMGFDALYLFVQTLGVAVFGVGATRQLPPLARFGLEVAVMLGFSLGLYGWLIGRLARRIHLLVLIGMVCGVFFRSLTQFVQRILDPTEFVVVQDAMFADFTDADTTLLGIAAVVVGLVAVAARRLFPRLDVMSLGHDPAISLGVDHRRMTVVVLVMAAVLVSVSTALVGPTTFFGLLVVHLGYRLVRTGWHRTTVPAAIGVAFVVLVAGQLLLERVLGLDSVLAVAVEFLGGLAFLLLLTRRPR
ncbi:iron chelate uptake ABC transporter family permease subunit [Raineyella sp. W15-4]|uniref:iron chelate uptake ABC transporter family permease subunit n=1 Tax=Raineyella sp. W15-4 TaxID=3081651 RepID=UPI002955259F|nr:iron chelate uptake ABC transporter family permease subunit [Raineyella sp. W15-4]WOQ17668.1 iron chelate uptake ABC transporter family permease subunit [Raineyella sp. W15-4]